VAAADFLANEFGPISKGKNSSRLFSHHQLIFKLGNQKFFFSKTTGIGQGRCYKNLLSVIPIIGIIFQMTKRL